MTLPTKQSSQGQLMLTLGTDQSIIIGDDDMRLTLLGIGKMVTFLLSIDKGQGPQGHPRINVGNKDLVTLRTPKEKMVPIGENIEFFVSHSRSSDSAVVVGVRAPRDIPVHREKVFKRIQKSA